MKINFIILLMYFSFSSYAQLKNGEPIPNLKLNTVINAPVKAISVGQLKGKVVVIDFWATWCGSCIATMPHLGQLQQQYAGKLQVLAVTDESDKRVRQFLSVRAYKLWFVVDTGRTLSGYFPHRLIPHTVLISPTGRLIANTSPEFVTSAVIDSVLKNQEVHLPVKKDFVYTTVEDLFKTTFPTADTVKQRFVMEGELPGAPGLSTTYRTNPAWSGRRLSAINLTLPALYNLAYGNVPYLRTIDSTRRSNKTKPYRVDVITQYPDSLLPTMQRELKKRFDVQARMVRQRRDVYVLKIIDQEKFAKITSNTSGQRTYMASHGAIDQQAITMADFAEFLESYGINKIVIDETGNQTKYDIKFTFQPENPQSLTDVLTNMGLQLDKQQREVDLLMIYEL